MTYSGPVWVIGCDVLLFGEPEDALLEDKLGLGGSHGTVNVTMERLEVAVSWVECTVVEKELEPAFLTPSGAASGIGVQKVGLP
jgi:hypothetical protein